MSQRLVKTLLAVIGPKVVTEVLRQEFVLSERTPLPRLTLVVSDKGS